MAEKLSAISGWQCTFYSDVRQVAVALLTKTQPGGDELRVEVLRSVAGLGPDDLAKDEVRQLYSGEQYRIPSPLVLLKAKLANLILFKSSERPQDIRHVEMLVPISRIYLEELHASVGQPEMTERNFLGAPDYAHTVVTSQNANGAFNAHRIDVRAVFPDSLKMSPHSKIAAFATHQIPRLFGPKFGA